MYLQEKEKRRVQEGKAMGDMKQKMADQEIIRNAEALRREKLETQAAKERVKAQIEADRKAREVQFKAVDILAQLSLVSESA